MTENSNKNYEKEILSFWKEKDIFKKIVEKNKGNKLFSFIDGPPYPTGEAHLGHLRNWSIKDFILRFKRFEGFDVYAKDGYDVHGLPVENKVQSKLNLKTTQDLRNFGEENFVKECKKYVDEIIDEMSSLRDRFALSMDRNHYHTSHPDYVSMSWKFFKKAYEKGLLYKDYKTVAWCPNDETTLSDYEIKDTYKVLEDPSIYVKFPITENYKKTPYPESLLIWTTTPWTLQSNLAIAMNPYYDYSYVLVKLNGKEEVLIIATDLVEKVIEVLKKQNEIEFIEILKTQKGSDFEGIKYDHIYLDETPSQKEFLNNEIPNLHSVVLAEYVTLGEGESVLDKLEKKGYKHSNKEYNEEKEELNQSSNSGKKSEGTGLVHIAPGHGFDDYNVGIKYDLPIFCPIDEKGVMTEGKFKGLYFKDIDPKAIEYLREKGFLLYADKKSHRYPCCWRCKTPIVYRAAEQWWIKRSQYSNEIIKLNNEVEWFPKSARISFNNLMEKAGDWPISRQRFWGIPLPIFEDEDGNIEVFGSKEELEERIGRKLDDIHRDDLKNIIIKNKKSGKDMKPVPYIADVWFDSGCASFASHYGEGLSFDEIIKKYYPLSWITEGEDQIRGWFSSLFNVGYVVTGKAPYKQVLFYRYVMDKFGQKMSKSIGNGISGNEAIDKWGADKTRYYLLTKAPPESQINFDPEEFELINGVFNTIDNISKFVGDYLEENSDLSLNLNISKLDVEDLWILSRWNSTLRSFIHNLSDYKINISLKYLEEFLIKDFSKTYLKLVKDRTNEKDENLFSIFNNIMKDSLILLSCAIPFKAEYLYQNIPLSNKKESIFLENLPEVDELVLKYGNELDIEENFNIVTDIVGAVLNAREKAKIGVRWPLSEINIISSINNLDKKLEPFEKLIKKLTNILKIKYDSSDIQINYIIKPNFKTLKVDFGDQMSNVIKAINLSKFEISNDLKLGKNIGVYEGVELDLDKHVLKEVELSDNLVSADFKGGNIILHTEQDEILLEEGYLREIIRRVQQTRKDFGFDKKERIKLSFDGSDNYLLELTKNLENIIKKRVGADEILEKELKNKKEFNIKDNVLVVSIEKL
jgi:isoleucyl-tRNA synthetase